MIYSHCLEVDIVLYNYRVHCCIDHSSLSHRSKNKWKHVRGRSDKYLAYERKTKILEKWRFISQHSLLLARYT